MDFSKFKPSNRIQDRTTDAYRNRQDWVDILGRNALEEDARRFKYDPHEAIQGLSPEDLRNVLWKKAWDYYGGGSVENIPFGFPFKEGINPNNNWVPNKVDWLKALKGMRK